MCKEVLGRVVSVFLVTASLQLLSIRASASRVTIFDVRKSLPMTADEVVYHDYFINAGTEVGLKPGAIVIVTRRIPLHDPMQNRSQGDLEIQVAKLQVIHAQSNLAVARFYSGYDRKLLPTLEYDAVMAGDRIDVTAIEFIDNKGKGQATGASNAAPRAAEKEERQPAQVAIAPQPTVVVSTVAKAPQEPAVVPVVAKAPQLEVSPSQAPAPDLPPQPALNSEIR